MVGQKEKKNKISKMLFIIIIPNTLKANKKKNQQIKECTYIL